MNASVLVWNDGIAMKLLPNNLILIVYMIKGFCGNGFVIFTYLCSKLWQEEERYFIPYLSAADLFACLVCASFGIILNLNQVTFDDSVLCKTWWLGAVQNLVVLRRIYNSSVHLLPGSHCFPKTEEALSIGT